MYKYKSVYLKALKQISIQHKSPVTNYHANKA